MIRRIVRRIRNNRNTFNTSHGAKEQQSKPSNRGRLPDFLIIGAQRCGTTSLYRLLCCHPGVTAAEYKEIHYFDWSFDKSLAWYRSCFPDPDERTLTGEATPSYMFYPRNAQRIAQTLPDIRLIAMLRNPVNRAYSQYRQQLRKDQETLSFEKALVAEEERLAQAVREGTVDRPSINHRRFSYFSRGLYAEQLESFLEIFGNRLLILKSEDFYEDPQAVLRQVQQFLRLPEHPLSHSRGDHFNLGKYPPMSPNTREYLAAAFEPHNEKLYRMVGRNFNWES